MRAPRRETKSLSVYLLEHEVTVGSELTGIEVVAKFVHVLPQNRYGFRTVCRGGLISLTLRRRNRSNNNNNNNNTTKRIGTKALPKCMFHLEKNDM